MHVLRLPLALSFALLLCSACGDSRASGEGASAEDSEEAAASNGEAEATTGPGTDGPGTTGTSDPGTSTTESETTGDSDGDDCTEISVTSWLAVGDANNPAIISGTVSPSLGGDAMDRLQIELFYSPEPIPIDIDIDLGTPLNMNYATCKDCIRAFEDDEGGVWEFARLYLAQSGTLRFTEVAGEDLWRGSLNDVMLVEVTQDMSSYNTVPVPGGRCLTVTTEFDTLGGVEPEP